MRRELGLIVLALMGSVAAGVGCATVAAAPTRPSETFSEPLQLRVERLARALASRTDSDRTSGARELATDPLAARRLVPDLVRLLEDRALAPRYWALCALANGDCAEAEALRVTALSRVPAAVHRTVGDFLDLEDEHQSGPSVCGLPWSCLQGEIPAATPSIPALMDACASPHAAVRECLLRGIVCLVCFPDHLAEPRVSYLDSALHDPAPAVRAIAAEALAFTPIPVWADAASGVRQRVLAALERALRDPDPVTRGWGATGLVRLGVERADAITGLMGAIRTPPWHLQEAATDAALGLPSAHPGAIVALVEAWPTACWWSRVSFAHALAALADTQRKAVDAALQDAPPDLVVAVVRRRTQTAR